MPPRLIQVLVSICLVAPAAQADEPETDEALEAQPFLTLHHTGYFRFRADLFLNGDLGNGVAGFRTSGLSPLLHDSPKNAHLGEPSEVLANANIRFRWRPELRIGQRLKIGVTLDVLDNLVLGSTPDYHLERPDAPLRFLSESQIGANEVIRIKHAWISWDVLHAIVLSAGRMGDHFGLGMNYNNGECLDCDYGDSTDRVSALIRAFGASSLWFFDAPGEGATTSTQLEGYGQPHDLSSSDDVIRWGFTLGYTPMDGAAEKAYKKDLESGEPVFDAVLRNTFTSQVLGTTGIEETIGDCEPGLHPDAIAYDCRAVARRDVSIWSPDLWFRVQYQPRPGLKLRAELEFAAVVGDAGTTQDLPISADQSTAKEFLAFGGVLQLEVQHGMMSYQLESGFATGDDVAFGAFGPGYVAKDSDSYLAGDPSRGINYVDNTQVSSFMFDRDYHVDMLMYREVVGAVTNSVYIKPTVTATFVDDSDLKLGTQLSLIYGHAIDARSTPGQDNPMGVETDLKFFYEAPGVARADLEMGFLVPLSAFRRGPNGPDAEPAFTIQTRLTTYF